MTKSRRGRRLHGEPDGQAQIDVLQQAQRPVEAARHLHRFQHHQFLDRAQRAHAAAERAPEEQRHQQRQEEDRGDHDGDGVARIGQRHRDVLDGADGADAAFAVEAEVGQAGDGQREHPLPAAP